MMNTVDSLGSSQGFMGAGEKRAISKLFSESWGERSLFSGELIECDFPA